MTKIILLFLIFVLVMGMFGRWKTRLPRFPARKRQRIKTAEKCATCGAYRIGSNPCTCGSD